MTARADIKHPAFKAIFVSLLVMIAVCAISFVSGFITGALRLPPLPLYVVAAFNFLAPVLAGTWWFRSKVGRAMSHQERLAFAAGITSMYAALEVGITYAMARMGLQTSPIPLALLMGALFLIFIAVYLLAWLITFSRRPKLTT